MVEAPIKREQEDVGEDSSSKKLKLQHGEQLPTTGKLEQKQPEIAIEDKKPKLEDKGDQNEGENVKQYKSDQSDDQNVKQLIVKQLNYYFSEANIVRDKFLAEQFKLDEGWVKITVLLTFKRLQALCNKPELIVEALEEYKSEVIELDETKQKIRRIGKIPNREDLMKEFEKRTVHVSGFPMDYTFDMLEKYLLQFGPIQSLQMRTHFKTRAFKGCVHVIFEQEADAKKVLNTEDLKCKDRELRKESMDEYHRRKKEISEKRKEKKKSASK